MFRKFLPLLLVAFQSAAFAQGAPITDAYRQLRLLSSSTQTGISYKDFGDELRKVNGLIDIAVKYSRPSNLTEKLVEIKVIYSDIAEVWRCRFSSRFISVALSHCLSEGFMQRNNIAASLLKSQLAENKYAHMNAPTSVVISRMFGEASSQVKQLGEMLKTR